MPLAHRPVAEHDLPLIRTFSQSAKELFFLFPAATFPLTVAQLQAAMAGRAKATVVELGGEVAALADLYRWQTSGHRAIGNVIIAPAAGCRGAGQYLVERMIDEALATCRAADVPVSCFSGNAAGLLFYPKLGSQPYAIEARQDRQGRRVALIHLRLRREAT